MFRIDEDNLGGLVPPVINPNDMDTKEKELDQFIRIATARYGKKFKFKPQRRAVIAKMYRSWKERRRSLS